jgi:hypothetical protein
LVSGRSKAAKIREVTKYREISEKYQPNTRKVIKERIRYMKNRCMDVKIKGGISLLKYIGIGCVSLMLIH